MKKINIEWLSDHDDCDTCGPSYAEGARVTIDGEAFGDFIPVSHCFGGASWDQTDVYKQILAHLGYTVNDEYVGEED